MSTPRRGWPNSGALRRPRTSTDLSPNSTSAPPDDETVWQADAPEQAPELKLEEPVGHRRPSPAHEVAPLDPDELELAALTHTAAQAEERIADRESEEAAHDAFEAELDAIPEHDLGDVSEAVAPVRLGDVLRRWPDED